MHLQERILNGEKLSSDSQNALSVLAALMDGANLIVIDTIALANIAGRLKAGQIARDATTATQSSIPVLALDQRVHTDHVLSGIAPAMALRAIPVMPSATPVQAIAAYTMQEVNGTLSKWPDGGNILTLTPVNVEPLP
jgi:hypothetical protein